MQGILLRKNLSKHTMTSEHSTDSWTKLAVQTREAPRVLRCSEYSLSKYKALFKEGKTPYEFQEAKALTWTPIG